jgi:hypothetical protein
VKSNNAHAKMPSKPLTSLFSCYTSRPIVAQLQAGDTASNAKIHRNELTDTSTAGPIHNIKPTNCSNFLRMRRASPEFELHYILRNRQRMATPLVLALPSLNISCSLQD